MLNHTPLPWHVHDMEKTTICTPGGLAIVTSNSPGPSTNENKANAAFIVRAVNAHEELMAALATMIDGYHTLASSVEETEVWLTNPGVVRAIDTFQAIAKAEGTI